MKPLESLAFDKRNVENLPKPLDELSGVEIENKKLIGRVTTYVLKYLSNKFVDNGFEWLLPIVFSKSTDPLWPDPGASIDKKVEFEIYGETVKTTSSMIVHKMVACSLVHPKLFTFSPNIRIERRERAYTGIHAYEFTQLDFEIRYASAQDIRSLVEKILSELMESLKKDLREEFVALGRYQALRKIETPFEVYDRTELLKKYGDSWENKIISSSSKPVWITNIPREFYDFEDFEGGQWDNYDLMLPGYGEVLSGSRREWEYRKIVKKMDRDGIRKENYRLFLKLAKEGRLKPSAGAGIGIERLIQWLVGAKHVGEVQPFPKIPGIVYEL
ncbi:MAG: asparagine synthetase A [Candidatus Bathyarchaeales archaeon]